ncbi:MAG: hypothetical protein WC335_00105 [Candidatus Omnitrophota bacterium]|jgi:hypothetical protein
MDILLKTAILVICIFLTAEPGYTQLLKPPYIQNKNDPEPKIKSFFKDPAVSKHPLLETLKPAAPEPAPAQKKYRAFLDFINNKTYAADVKLSIMKNDKTVIREEWSRVLGIDIFYPYFKAKEIEDWISEKGSFKIGKLKGKPRFEDNKFRYVFKMKF